jgi:hypothetical protein
MLWNVAGELQRPKNMTVGSNNPLCVLNAAFHWSPSLIRILLYPHQTLALLKYFAPFSLSIVSEIKGTVKDKTVQVLNSFAKVGL